MIDLEINRGELVKSNDADHGRKEEIVRRKKLGQERRKSLCKTGWRNESGEHGWVSFPRPLRHSLWLLFLLSKEENERERKKELFRMKYSNVRPRSQATREISQQFACFVAGTRGQRIWRHVDDFEGDGNRWWNERWRMRAKDVWIENLKVWILQWYRLL